MLLTIFLLISGCERLNATFIQTVHDHRILTVETNEAVLSALSDECATVTDADALEGCKDLSERLRVISYQSIAIDKYIINELTEEELAMFIRSKWRMHP